MEKDYSLLRPFDLEAAKAGEAICTDDLENVQYIAGPDEYSNVVLKTGPYFVLQRHRLRMKPLCWVEGRPVYKGDVLWHDGAFVEAARFHDETLVCVSRGWDHCHPTTEYTWTTPKVKREGWVNVYPGGDALATLSAVWPTKEVCDELHSPGRGRIACIRIEWEE